MRFFRWLFEQLFSDWPFHNELEESFQDAERLGDEPRS